ncbi:MAG: CPBP family intramembrane metalloprotease [Ruminiclostridium sp.]|nr:CPBP family intramembrane metalloprotease [Ruminiclostridium sp.]
MSNDKKLTIKRLLIFLVISFLPFIVIVPIMWAYYGEPIFVSEKDNVMAATSVLGVFGMMIPSCANLITRLVTREGFGRSYLGLNCKGKMGYFIASVLVPLAYSAVTMLVLCAVQFGGIQESLASPSLQNTGLFLLNLAFSIVIFFPAFGEEWGWRGYMMPKLMELMPKPAAVAAGGVIWGLWHAPLTAAGHNFGVDYPGYPWLGILFMCVDCVCMNAFLTLITEKTRSVYPAAFAHALNNNLSATILLSIFGTQAAAEQLTDIEPMSFFMVYLAVLALVGIVSMILLLKGGKKGSAALDNAA